MRLVILCLTLFPYREAATTHKNISSCNVHYDEYINRASSYKLRLVNLGESPDPGVIQRDLHTQVRYSYDFHNIFFKDGYPSHWVLAMTAKVQ